MKHIGINAKVASHVFSLLASVEGTTVCLEIPLQSPPPPGDCQLATVSLPHPGDRRALTREFARGAGGTRTNGDSEILKGGEGGQDNTSSRMFFHLDIVPSLNFGPPPITENIHSFMYMFPNAVYNPAL